MRSYSAWGVKKIDPVEMELPKDNLPKNFDVMDNANYEKRTVPTFLSINSGIAIDFNEETGEVAIAFSFCSPKDRFSKKVAYSIALNRLTKNPMFTGIWKGDPSQIKRDLMVPATKLFLAVAKSRANPMDAYWFVKKTKSGLVVTYPADFDTWVFNVSLYAHILPSLCPNLEITKTFVLSRDFHYARKDDNGFLQTYLGRRISELLENTNVDEIIAKAKPRNRQDSVV